MKRGLESTFFDRSVTDCCIIPICPGKFVWVDPDEFESFWY
jgi:hypothetical protein